MNYNNKPMNCPSSFKDQLKNTFSALRIYALKLFHSVNEYKYAQFIAAMAVITDRFVNRNKISRLPNMLYFRCLFVNVLPIKFSFLLSVCLFVCLFVWPGHMLICCM